MKRSLLAISVLLGMTLSVAGSAYTCHIRVNGDCMSPGEIRVLEQRACAPIPSGSYWLLNNGVWGYAGDPPRDGSVTRVAGADPEDVRQGATSLATVITIHKLAVVCVQVKASLARSVTTDMAGFRRGRSEDKPGPRRRIPLQGRDIPWSIVYHRNEKLTVADNKGKIASPGRVHCRGSCYILER